MNQESIEKWFKEQEQLAMKDLLFEVLLTGASDRHVQPIIDKGEITFLEVEVIERNASKEIIKRKEKNATLKIQRNPHCKPTIVDMDNANARMRAKNRELLNRLRND